MTRLLQAVAAMMFVGTVNAGEICYGPAGPGTGAPPPDAGTVFTCPTAGVGTMNQLAELGWRIVRLTPVSVGGGNSAAQLVIRRPSEIIFANGFDP